MQRTEGALGAQGSGKGPSHACPRPYRVRLPDLGIAAYGGGGHERWGDAPPDRYRAALSPRRDA